MVVASLLGRSEAPGGNCGGLFVKKPVDTGPINLHCEYMKGLRPPAKFPSVSLPTSARSGGFWDATNRIAHGAGAFTLIELMVVVAIVAVLAGLALSTMGYANRKGAASRAKTEVAALSSAIESYQLDFGSYPASNNLYTELTAGGPTNTNKVYFEPPPGMVNTNAKPYTLQDPYGTKYNYLTNPTRNIGFFDLWCVPPDAKTQADWIHN